MKFMTMGKSRLGKAENQGFSRSQNLWSQLKGEKPMVRGYMRVPTKRQTEGTSLDDQRATLEAAGCTKIYSDVWTGSTMDRPGFNQLYEDLQSGDTVVFTKLDRVSRRATAAYDQIEAWVDAGIKVDVLNMATMDNSPQGKLFLLMLLGFAEFERSMITERMQGGRAYRRATDPNYKEGRKPAYSKAQLDHAMDLLKDHSFSRVAELTGISKSTITREARRRGFRKSEL